MSIAALVPVEDMASANAALAAQGFGPRNFSVPVFTTRPEPTHATLHAWGDDAFAAAVKALPGVVWSETGALPEDRLEDALSGVSGRWRPVPLEGQIEAGRLYVDPDKALWWAIQSYDAAIYPDPSAIPALIRPARIPGAVMPWSQPTDAFDAYKLVNPFTGAPDRVTHGGQTWVVAQADGSGNNTWEPGVFGWEAA